VFTLRRFNRNLSKKSRFFIGVIKANTIGLFTKRDFLIIAFFTLLGAGGVFAATLITISTPDSQGAAYVAATACDENVTIRALTAPDAATGQLYVATIALSDISQNATTGCGNKTMQVALKINNQMRYATWDIPEASTDSTFYLTGATSSISDYYADTLLSPFQADGLTNVAIANIGSFTYSTWTARQTDTNRYWYSITSSSDGTKLAAVAQSGLIYTSTNSGVTWTEQTASGIRNWWSITSSSDGTKLAAVVYPGYIYTSSDSGVSWTARSPVTTATIRYWYSITSSSDGTKLAAVVSSGYIYTSTDSGASWTARTNADGGVTGASLSKGWRSITSSSDGTKLAAVAYGGYIYTSSDSGASWTAASTDATRGWFSITSSSDGTKLAAVVYGGFIYTSINSGATWTQQTASGSRYWYSIASSSDGTKLAAVDLGGYIYTSSDSGVSWTATSTDTNRNWRSITSSSDGTKLAAGYSGGYIYTGVNLFSRSSN
jgi:hypothetical protein